MPSTQNNKHGACLACLLVPPNSAIYLVLHAHPELVHLCKVHQQELDGINHIATICARTHAGKHTNK